MGSSCQSRPNASSTAAKGAAPSRSVMDRPKGEDWELRAKAHASFAAGLLRGLNNDPDGLTRHFEAAHAADPSQEDLALEVGRRHLQAGRITNALPTLRRAAAQTNASAELFALYGMALFQAGFQDEAIDVYLKSVSQPPVMPSVAQTTVRLLLSRKRIPEAIQTLDRISADSTNQPALWLDLADLYLLAGAGDASLTNRTIPKAIAQLDRVRKLGTEDATMVLRLADRYAALGRLPESESVLKDFQARAPRNPAAVARLAEMYLRSGRVPEAGTQLEALRKLEPSNPMTYFLLGAVAMEERQFEKARNHYERVLLLNPGFEPAYADLALAYFNLDRPDDAVTVLERARRDFAPNFRIEYLLAVSHLRLKRLDASWTHFQAAEALGKTNRPPLTDHRFYFQVGSMLQEKGDEARSIEYLEKSLEIDPEYDEALNHLGYMFAEKGENLERAQAMIEAAVKAEPENPAYQDSLGWVLFRRGKAAEAVDWLRKAVAGLKKPDATVLDHLGDCLAALGRWSEARDAWKASLEAEKSEAVERKLRDAAHR